VWQTVTRERLYEQVWSVPLSQLCERYGLSDNGLRKVCRRLNVPIPWRGYWAKVEAGHRVKQTPLPPLAEKRVTQIWTEPKREKTEEDAADTEWLRERTLFEADPTHAIEVVIRRKRWHAAIAPLHEFFEEEVKDVLKSRRDQDAYEKWPEWRKQRESNPGSSKWHWVVRNGELMPASHGACVARLSLAQYRRGLAILNGVAVAATKRGFEVTYSEAKGRILLKGHGGELELRMSEATEQKTRKVKRYDGKFEEERYRVPTGRLRLYAERGYGKVWSCEESAESPLEAKVNAFFAGVWKQVVLCRQKARDEEARERRAAVLAAERAEVERQAREEEARREAERQRRAALTQEVGEWRQAMEVRAYVAAVRAEAALRGDNAESSLSEWAAWALGVAREMDPVARRVDTSSRGATA